MAFWALLVFGSTICLVALFVFLTSGIKEPARTEVFRKFSMGWIRTFLFLVGCRFVIKGRENFKKGKVYVVTCNHNSFLDVPVLTPFVPGPNKTIAKAEMAKIPIFGIVYRRGSILVDRKNKESRRQSFVKMIKVLEDGMHMCIYPEGTRNKTAMPLKEFHDGAFRLAVDTGKEIIPALVFNTKKIMPPEKKFYFRPSKIELHFLEAIPPGNDFEELKQKVHSVMNDHYMAYFQKN